MTFDDWQRTQDILCAKRLHEGLDGVPLDCFLLLTAHPQTGVWFPIPRILEIVTRRTDIVSKNEFAEDLHIVALAGCALASIFFTLGIGVRDSNVSLLMVAEHREHGLSGRLAKLAGEKFGVWAKLEDIPTGRFANLVPDAKLLESAEAIDLARCHVKEHIRSQAFEGL